MARYRSEAIANEFLRRRASNEWPVQMKLQKLAYIANGWNLAINGEPLISEVPQAWDNGPVYRRIWDHIKDHGYSTDQCLLVDPVSKKPYQASLTEAERAVIDHVWAKYGNYSASELSRLTHEPGTPWFKAYFERGRNSELRDSEIRDHYVQLALAGREQA